MSNSTIFILGTSRAAGNTRKIVDCMNKQLNAPIVNLSDYSIGNYDYEYKNEGDDFIGIMEQVLNYKTIVFATPVYWYSMSTQLKAFFDRFSDLVRIHKTAGRALAGRKTFLVASGTSEELPPGFEGPFRLTSQYLDMNYSGAFYSHVRADLVLDTSVAEQANSFAKRIFDND